VAPKPFFTPHPQHTCRKTVKIYIISLVSESAFSVVSIDCILDYSCPPYQMGFHCPVGSVFGNDEYS